MSDFVPTPAEMQLAQMHRGLTLQSRRSAWGAIAAALAALCQVAATLWR